MLSSGYVMFVVLTVSHEDCFSRDIKECRLVRRMQISPKLSRVKVKVKVSPTTGRRDDPRGSG